jgi:Cohesin domain/PEP-CTERM motif
MSRWQSWKSGALGAVVFGALAASPALAVPTVSLTGTAGQAQVGAPLALTVRISDVVDLYTYQFSLAFNPAVLQASSVTEGPFLGSGGNTFFGPGAINNTTGTIAFTFDSLIGFVPGVSGSGNLATLNFNVVSAGISSLVFSDVLFLSSQDFNLLPVVQNGSVTAVVPEPSGAALLLAGLGGLLAWRRSRRSAT